MGDEQERLFMAGLDAFNRGEFYDAHEFWEDLWSDYKLVDALLIQGLIQVAVGCFHLTNANINGAVGLFTKCLPKLEQFTANSRGLPLSALIEFVQAGLVQLGTLEDTRQFDWAALPQLAVTVSPKDRYGKRI